MGCISINQIATKSPVEQNQVQGNTISPVISSQVEPNLSLKPCSSGYAKSCEGLCNQGQAESCETLSNMYRIAYGAKFDEGQSVSFHQKATILFSKRCEKGDIEACLAISAEFEEVRKQTKKELHKRCEKKDLASCKLYANSYAILDFNVDDRLWVAEKIDSILVETCLNGKMEHCDEWTKLHEHDRYEDGENIFKERVKRWMEMQDAPNSSTKESAKQNCNESNLEACVFLATYYSKKKDCSSFEKYNEVSCKLGSREQCLLSFNESSSLDLYLSCNENTELQSKNAKVLYENSLAQCNEQNQEGCNTVLSDQITLVDHGIKIDFQAQKQLQTLCEDGFPKACFELAKYLHESPRLSSCHFNERESQWEMRKQSGIRSDPTQAIDGLEKSCELSELEACELGTDGLRTSLPKWRNIPKEKAEIFQKRASELKKLRGDWEHSWR